MSNKKESKMSAFDKLLSKTHLADNNILEEAAKDIVNKPLTYEEAIDNHNKVVMERVKQRMLEERNNLDEEKNTIAEFNKEIDGVEEFIKQTKEFFDRSKKDEEAIIEMRNATLQQIEDYRTGINDLNVFLNKVNTLHGAIKKMDKYRENLNKIEGRLEDAKTIIDNEVKAAETREELAKKGIHVKPKTK